jgi:hypothetical protein
VVFGLFHGNNSITVSVPDRGCCSYKSVLKVKKYSLKLILFDYNNNDNSNMIKKASIILVQRRAVKL